MNIKRFYIDVLNYDKNTILLNDKLNKYFWNKGENYDEEDEDEFELIG